MAAIPVPQIKLKNPLDGITSTLFRVPPTPLPSPVAREYTAPISQPNGHVNEPVGESPGSEAPVGTATLPLVVAAISNGQPKPTPAVSSSINGAIRDEPTVDAPKKASKARPSNKKNGRDLCILRWLKQVKKDGTTPDFRVYWDALDTQQRNAYESDAAQLVTSNVWVKNTVQAVVDGTLY
ncbi:hypothetical protein CY34DRAFT_19703 [Suillus luteus UH-Slu-Lm8-n1]|uniref:Uncharacterized protein n=1 Tax=Suillus luteus UH-Slu-Lm8-n1 TaxID=930992 RepID=A0A0D0ABM7_9AGAM|nr:hypothetical protein CY34DRAFT_19703 [Suillus luteus UH-Slu-Lm8-n1]